jgi:hypothetical protein
MDIKYSEWFKGFMNNNYQEIPLKFEMNWKQNLIYIIDLMKGILLKYKHIYSMSHICTNFIFSIHGLLCSASEKKGGKNPD